MLRSLSSAHMSLLASKLHSTTFSTRKHQRKPLLLTPNHTLLLIRQERNNRKSLQQPHNRIRNLHECEVLTQTSSRAPIERKVGPTEWTRVAVPLPSLRAEFICIWAIDILAAGIDILRVDDQFAAPDKDGCGSVWTPTTRQDCGFGGCAVV